MFTYSDLNEAITAITETWGEAGRAVVANAFNEHRKMEMEDFLPHCVACGGNWGGMFLTGLKALYPKTYEAIPDNMGINAFSLICHTMMLCGINTGKVE